MARPAAAAMMLILAIGKIEMRNGFTLVELLVVLAILGLLTGGVLLLAPDRSARARPVAEALAARIAMLRERAILSAAATRLRVDAQGYRFEQRRNGAWHPLDARAAQPWPRGVHPDLPAPEIGFDASGDARDDAELLIADAQAKLALRVSAHGAINVVAR